jgi:hypothetical protein
MNVRTRLLSNLVECRSTQSLCIEALQIFANCEKIERIIASIHLEFHPLAISCYGEFLVLVYRNQTGLPGSHAHNLDSVPLISLVPHPVWLISWMREICPQGNALSFLKQIKLLSRWNCFVISVLV